MSPLWTDALRVVRAGPPGGIRQRFLDLLTARPDAVRADHPEAHVTASALVVAATGDRVLLCLHGRVRQWMQLGGHLEPDDASVADAALREATEESGIDGLRLVPTPIDLDIHPVTCRNGPSRHFDIRFAAVAPPGAVERSSDESLALGWFAPDALPTPLAPAVARLVAPALVAARTWDVRGSAARRAP